MVMMMVIMNVDDDVDDDGDIINDSDDDGGTTGEDDDGDRDVSKRILLYIRNAIGMQRRPRGRLTHMQPNPQRQ